MRLRPGAPMVTNFMLVEQMACQLRHVMIGCPSGGVMCALCRTSQSLGMGRDFLLIPYGKNMA